mmetsp:Transcript_42482/g.92698  ORF Transcript_42482/g.92698 Transcript_42482/m.92698 type:complete len:213 (-) Transcript_42482:558-1196(-)
MLVNVGKQRSRAILAVNVAHQVLHVLCEHQAGLGRHQARQVVKSDHSHSVLGHVPLTLLGKLAVASTSRGQIHNYRSRLHVLDHVLLHKERRRSSGDGSRGDDDVTLLANLMELLLLSLLEFRRRLLGVASNALSCLLELDAHPAGPQRGCLVTDITHIPGLHNRPQGLGLANSRKTGHTTAQHKGLGRRVFAGSSDLRALEPPERVRCFEN